MKNKLKNILQKINVFILSAVLVCAMLPVRADAAYEIPGTCQIQTDSGAQNTVKTLDYSYDRNTYFSLRDIAVLLNGTEKSFSLEVTKNAVALNPGNAYTPVGGENTPGRAVKTRISPCGATSSRSPGRPSIIIR